MPLTTGLPVSRLIKVDVVLTTPALIAQTVNTCLLLGTSNVIDTVERMREYANISEVAADFGDTTEEYFAAALWFAQNPSPDNLKIGRWAKVATAASLVGQPRAPLQQLMSNWTALNNGAFTLTLDASAPAEIGPLDFTNETNLNGVASVIQAALPLGATVLWNANRDVFTITSSVLGSGSKVAFLEPPTTGTYTDISGPDFLGMQAPVAGESGAYTVPGLPPETALTAATRMDQLFSSQWYGLVVPSATDTDHQQLAAYCEAADPPHYYGVTTEDPGSLVAATNTDIGYILHNFGYNKSAVQFSRSLSPGADKSYAIMSYLGKILTTQWTGLNTTMTLMYKQEPGVAPENLSSQEANTLQNKAINVYTTYANGARMVEYGQSCSGEFTDTIIGADALALDIQAALFNVLYTTPTKVPQTDTGAQLLANAASATCTQYVGNGWLGTGTWNAQGFGTLKYGDLLTLGFYVYMPSMLTQNQADRQARRAPLMQIAAKTAGAIHTAEVLIWVNQ